MALEAQLACLSGVAARERCSQLGLPTGSRAACQKHLLTHFSEHPREVVRFRAGTFPLALYRRALDFGQPAVGQGPEAIALTAHRRRRVHLAGANLQLLGREPRHHQEKYEPITRALMQVLWDTLHEIAGDFSFSTAHINRNFCGAPHVDRNNVGLSMTFALGEYLGGELVTETENPRILACHDTHRRPVIFDGHRPHWVLPYKGIRYSIVLYTSKDGKSSSTDAASSSSGEGGAADC